MSVYTAPVVSFKREVHPNADKLFITKVGDTDYIIVCNIEDWKDENKFCWIEPDTLVPVSRPEFSFLVTEDKYDKNCNKIKGGGYALIRMKKLRGESSYGMAVKVPSGFNVGDDLFSYFELIHYNEPEKAERVNSRAVAGPSIFVPKYDLENLMKNRYHIDENEEVICTHKIHGQNLRVVYHNEKMYVGSRTEWKERENSHDLEGVAAGMKKGGKTDEEINSRLEILKAQPIKISQFWQSAESDPELFKWCVEHPDHIVFLENYGSGVSGEAFKYDAGNKFLCRAFDIMYQGRYLDYDEARSLAPNIKFVPELFRGKYNFNYIKELIEKDNEFNNNGICEGCVISPIKERFTKKGERVKYKLISNRYLLK